jgi:cyclopropane fatty-acyl-phospholipid synthase-like methyltransferase
MRVSLLACLLVACGGATKTASTPTPAPDHHHHGHVGHRFDKADEWAKVFDDPARDAWQKPAHVVALMKIDPGSTVVDLGAGTGYFLPHLAPAVGEKGRVIALDVEPDMVRYMKERIARDKLPNVEPRVIPTDDPQLAAASVDRILIVDTWHHISNRAAYAAKLAKALRPNGAVFVVDFTKDSERGPPKQHRLTPEQIIEDLKSAGLTAKSIEEDLPDQYMVMAFH